MTDERQYERVATRAQVASMTWNASLAYVVAQMVVIVLHESAHTAAGVLLGYRATQFTGEVRFTPDQTSTAMVVTAMAGPVFSLLSGLAAMPFRPFRGRGFAQLVWLWGAFLSAEEGFGYFIVAPLIRAGDTGVALGTLHAPGWAWWLSAVFGVAGVFFLARQFAVRGVRHTRDLYELRAFCFYPWIVGSLVSVALAALFLALTPDVSGAAAVAILSGSVSLGVFAPMAMSFWQSVHPGKELLTLRPPRAGIVAAVVLALVNVFVLVPGLRLG